MQEKARNFGSASRVLDSAEVGRLSQHEHTNRELKEKKGKTVAELKATFQDAGERELDLGGASSVWILLRWAEFQSTITGTCRNFTGLAVCRSCF